MTDDRNREGERHWVMREKQAEGEKDQWSVRCIGQTACLGTCLALSDNFLQTAATSRVSVGNLCWQWSRVLPSVASWTRSHRHVTALSDTVSTSPNNTGTRRTTAPDTEDDTYSLNVRRETESWKTDGYLDSVSVFLSLPPVCCAHKHWEDLGCRLHRMEDSSHQTHSPYWCKGRISHKQLHTWAHI